MKKFLFFILTLFATGALFAQTFASGGINYTVTSTVAPLTVEVSSNSGYTGAAIISNSVTNGSNSYAVTRIGSNAFNNCIGLTSVNIPNSVTSIGNLAFLYCSGLISVTIPNSVTSIGEYAFFGCTSLISVTIPNSVTSIGQQAFAYCSGLTSVTIPNSVTSIGYATFIGCSSLTSVTIPNSVTSIGDYAFYGCSSLTSVTIPNSVTSIGNNAFMYCNGLTSVTIPNSVTSIGDAAFAYCSGLTSVNIPNSVTSIGGGAFTGCTGLISVTVNWPNPLSIVPNVFQGVNVGVIPLIVPAGTEVAYEATPVWTDFIITIPCVTPLTPTFNPISPICSGTTVSPLSTTSNNLITGTWSPAFNGLATTTYTFTPNTGQCATTTTMTIVIAQSTQWFQDLDNDSYGVSNVWTFSCTQPIGYVNNNTDCNDNDATLHGYFAFYPDNDHDGYGGNFLALVCATNATSPPTGYSLIGNDCNDNNPTMHGTSLFYLDNDNDGFGGVAAIYLCSVNSTTPPTGFSTNSLDCNDTNPLINPSAVEICFDGIDNNCNGLIDENCVTSKVRTSQCGINLTAIDTTILADVPSVPVTSYKFRVTKIIAGVPSTNPADIEVFQSTSVAFPNSFRLTQLLQYAYNTSYQVEVSVEYLSVWQPYGVACTVTTPNATTKIRSIDCGRNLTCLSDLVYADLVPYAAGYRFNVLNLTDPTNVLTPQDCNLRQLNMNLFSSPSALYGCTYQVTVAIKNYDGTYTAFGTVCTITTPPFPTTQIRASQCNYSPLTNNVNIYADPLASSCPTVTRYRFLLTNTALGYSRTKVNNLRTFTLNQFTGLLTCTTYNVQVSVEINGVFGPYGPACSITTPGVCKAADEKEETPIEFKAIAFPNPFAENLNLNINTNSESNIQIRVYDMLGKLIDDRNVDATEISNFELGNNYPSGVYYIIVSQDENLQTLRVIKR